VVIAAHGEDVLERVTVARVDQAGRAVERTRRTVATDVLAVGWGFTPQLELPLALGCATRVDGDGSVVCVVDSRQQSSVEGVYLAGEVCGVGGAALAVVEGELAGSAAAGHLATDRRMLRRRTSLRRFAAAMHAAHPVGRAWVDRLEPDTILCRCEEVSVGRLREAHEEWGADDARSAKLLARTGMGWCQGRVCGYPTGEILAAWSGGASHSLPERPVATPLYLSTLESLAPTIPTPTPPTRHFPPTSGGESAGG
jgi:NAD(P)H-nitrite reductase large subunit